MELELPVALAGGLNADNVADAIKASGAAAVDVASGVERPIDDGMAARKDHGLVRRFINNARTAFAER
jgi:phosphoribosylanthranilate isomerase